MSTPKGDGFVIVFATAVCVVCSLLLSATASTLKAKQDFNVELDRKVNVLKAFGVAVQDESGRRISADEVARYFTDHIRDIVLDAATGQPIDGVTSGQVDAKELRDRTKLPLYLWTENGEVTKYAFPTSGKGLWSTIYGYLALEKDLATIAGVTFYRHGETPGLGGEVEKDWFQANFRGKKVFEGGERLRFEVVKGDAGDSDHAVDGISGATLTGKGVTRFVNRDLDLYEPYFRLHRGS